MKRVIWWDEAWDQYTTWNDRAMVRRVNDLIKDIFRGGHEGIGRPEPLRGNLSGFWSRRVNQEHRLVYRLVDDDVEILSCRYHYDQ